MSITFFKIKYLFVVALIFVLQGCKPFIALYDQYAYTQATSLKVDIQNLALESATTTYKDAKGDIKNVIVALQKAYQYSKGRDNNSLSTKQYEILLADDHFFKTFINNWQTKGMESAVFAKDVSDQTGNLMDQIIKLENGKNKNSK